MRNIIKDKNGWIEIVEAFVAVLLIAGVIVFLLNRTSNSGSELSTSIYKAELSILREVQSNDTLRSDVIMAPEPMPIDWTDSRFPAEVKNLVIMRAPSYLTCVGKICYMNQTCVTENAGEEGEDIYSQSVAITSILQNMSYRKLNLFCWVEQ